jgi:hypothetical protein
MPSGIAVAASPKLWIRSARRATLPVDRDLRQRRQAKHREREADRLQSLPRALDAGVDQAVAVAVPVVVMVVALLGVGVRATMGVRMHRGTVAMALAAERDVIKRSVH